MRKLKKYTPTKFKARGSYYDRSAADYAVGLSSVYATPKVHGQENHLN